MKKINIEINTSITVPTFYGWDTISSEYKPEPESFVLETVFCLKNILPVIK
jgi:hypothetical protein